MLALVSDIISMCVESLCRLLF